MELCSYDDKKIFRYVDDINYNPMPIFTAKICIIVEVPIPYYSVLYGMTIS